MIVDGSRVRHTKLDREIFVRAADELGLNPADCMVFENAEGGIEATQRADMGSVGIGRPETFHHADIVVAGLDQLLAVALIPGRLPLMPITA